MICQCKEWQENIDKVNAPNRFLFARNPNTYKGYDGVPFKYCPWCAMMLVKDEDLRGVADKFVPCLSG